MAPGWRWLGAAVAGLILVGRGIAAEPPPAGDFGKSIQLAPIVVNGKPVSVAVHARTKGDRRYGEKFADEVVEVAYETLGDSTGKGLVIVGAKGETHPIVFFRKFLAMSAAGQLDPSLAGVAADLDRLMKRLQEKINIQDNPEKPTGITFETFLPAVPLPLPGTASKLYQLAWAEGFDEKRVEQRLRTLTRADLGDDVLKRYDWVFYLPPHNTTSEVLKEILDKGLKAEKMGLIKRAAIRTAAFAARPIINKAVEALRKGMLFHTIVRAKGSWNEGDVDALMNVYVQELLPDLKPGSGDEKRRALAAIEKQKIANAEYAKDPFVRPARLATFDPAAYAGFLGEYRLKPTEVMCRFVREGDSFQWNYKDHKPRVFYPAGDRLLVNEDGSMTIQFLLDDKGAVTGVEERWVRRRQTIPRKS